MDTTKRCLLVFAKPARPGFVKTRLLGEFTAEEAAKLHSAFLHDLLERMEVADFQTQIAWAVEAQEPVPPSSFGSFRQQGKDLGERLFEGLSQALNQFDFAAAIGSDHPDLPVATVEAAFEKLASSCDVVVGPAVDGGYYLIGVTRQSLRKELFSRIEWSTNHVLQQTLERCRGLGLTVEELMPLSDVDTPDDLRRLALRLADGAGPTSPTTRSLLVEWGMIPVHRRTAP